MDELTRDDSNASCTQEVAQLASLAVRFVYAGVDFILLSHSLSRRFQGGFLVISIKSGKILAFVLHQTHRWRGGHLWGLVLLLLSFSY